MEEINGIIISGKVYVFSDASDKVDECASCDLCQQCDDLFGKIERTYCNPFHFKRNYHFRFSPELTDKLNE